MTDVTSVKEQAQKEVAEELAKKAVNALKAKLRQLADAQQIVKNIEREIADLEASIADGSFAGEISLPGTMGQIRITTAGVDSVRIR